MSAGGLAGLSSSASLVASLGRACDDESAERLWAISELLLARA